MITAKTSMKSRMFVFVEFGLQILTSCLKMGKFDVETTEDISQLDPFVPLIAQCLGLKYDRVIFFKKYFLKFSFEICSKSARNF